jgi:phosphate:Na+ symporter
VVVCAVFYILHGILDFAFMGANVTILSIATIHTLFNVFSTIILMPFCKLIEKLTMMTFKETKPRETTVFDTLDERFLSMPSFAVEKCRELICDMIGIAHKSVVDATALISKFDRTSVDEINESEGLVDMYEDKLSTYLVKLAGGNLTHADSKQVTELLHCVGDIERISDHAVNITEALEELNDKELSFSPAAISDISIISAAVNEIIELSSRALASNDLEVARSVEPLEQVIDKLKLKIKANHIQRLQSGDCSMEMGFILSDLLTNFERVADHCSNIAVCMIELAHGSFDTHEYLNNVKTSGDDTFVSQYEYYKQKYVI